MHCLCNEPQGSQLKLSSSCKERAAAAAAQFLLLPRPFVSQQTPSPPPYFFLSFFDLREPLDSLPSYFPWRAFFFYSFLRTIKVLSNFSPSSGISTCQVSSGGSVRIAAEF